MGAEVIEVIEVYEKGKPRLVSIDILKEFRGDSSTHGFPSDPQPSSPGGDEMEEIPNIILNHR